MIPLTPEEAAAALEVALVARSVSGVATDTRTLKPGDLFVALRGDTHDGHLFVAAAFAAGASGAVVESGAGISTEGRGERALPTERLYRVPDSRVALGSLARAVRRKSAALVVAVTGSVGKTGTKDLLSAAARRSRPVVATEANQNNEVGVPLTLLRLLPETGVAVVEMGMRGRGQILELGRIAEPDVGLVTKIAPVHLELLGDLAGVAAAKGELFRALRPGGVAVIPADEPLLEEQVERAGRRVVRYCYAGCASAEVSGSATYVDESRSVLEIVWPEGKVEVEVPFAGRHRLENAVAALAACYAAGLPVAVCAGGLPDAVFTPTRGDEYRVGDVVLVDDTYNANPTATRVALDDLVRRAHGEKGRPVAILGDMMELGPESRRYHREIGAYAAAVGVRGLIGVGPLSEAMVDGFAAVGGDPATGQGRAGLHIADLESGLADVVACIRPGDVVLVKGSRSMRLERVVTELRRVGAGGAVANDLGLPGGAR